MDANLDDTQEHQAPAKTARDLPRPVQWLVLVGFGVVLGGIFGSIAGLLDRLPGISS